MGSMGDGRRLVSRRVVWSCVQLVGGSWSVIGTLFFASVLLLSVSIWLSDELLASPPPPSNSFTIRINPPSSPPFHPCCIASRLPSSSFTRSNRCMRYLARSTLCRNALPITLAPLASVVDDAPCMPSMPAASSPILNPSETI